MKQWIAGEELIYTDLQSYLQNQVVPQFASTGTRDAQWPSPPTWAWCAVGATLYQYTGAAWYTPFRRLGYVQRTTGSASASAETVTLTLSAVTLPGSRLIRVQAGWRSVTGGAGEAVLVKIRAGTTTGGTQLADNAVTIAASGAQIGTGDGGRIDAVYTPSAGSNQWVLTVASTTANNVTLTATATSPIWLSVNDEGAV